VNAYKSCLSCYPVRFFFKRLNCYNNIKEFLDKLESEGKEDWQIRQAYKAIKVFLEDFMCLLIDFTEDSENGSTCKPVKKPK
jgi:hypothetical protein